MKRANITGLKDKRWVKVDGDNLECAVIPAAAGAMGAMVMLGAFSDDAKREICKKMFVDFKNYFEDDDEKIPVENTIEARMEIFDWRPARDAIAELITRAHCDLQQGEEGAVSE